MMYRFKFIRRALFLLSGAMLSNIAYAAETQAIAILNNTSDSNVEGTVMFIEQNDGLHLTGEIKGLTAGEHGFHVHQYGDCITGGEAMAVGGHFNPEGQPHGGFNDENSHAGDWGNLTADEKGVAQVDITDERLSLNGPQGVLGRAVVVHADSDDLVSQPAGDSGIRIGCGSIVLAEDHS